MNYAGFINPTNDLSLEINKKVRNVPRPSLRTIGKWRDEWVKLGYDHKMTFQSYKKHKCKQWHKNRKNK